MGRKTHGEGWWETAPPHIIRCTSHYKSGDRCRREANPGANVCGQHGALIPAVQARAAVRIQMNADTAAKQLVDWMNDASVDMRERVKIAQDMLDRSGLNAVQKHLVGIGPVDPVEDLFARILADPAGLAPNTPVPQELSAQQLEWNRLADPEDHDWCDVVDVEVIEDPPVVASARPPKHIREALQRLI